MSDFVVGDKVRHKETPEVILTIEVLHKEFAVCSWLNRLKNKKQKNYRLCDLEKVIDPWEGYEGGIAVGR